MGSDTSAIAAARDQFMAALRSGDAEAVAAAYTADARLLAPSADLLTGRVAITRFWQAGIDAGVETIELDAVEIDVEPGGDTAYEIGRYVLRLRPPTGTPVIDRGRYVLVYRHQADGSWRRAVETFNPDVPPSEQPGPPRSISPPAPLEGAS